MDYYLLVALVCLIAAGAMAVLWNPDDDWPDDDHLEGPRGGSAA